MSGQRQAAKFPELPAHATIVTLNSLLHAVKPAGTRCLTVGSNGPQLQFKGLHYTTTPAVVITFLIGGDNDNHICVPIDGPHASNYLSIAGLLFNARNRETGRIPEKYKLTSAYPSFMCIDFVVYYFELFGLVCDDQLRKFLVQMLVSFGNYKVTDRLEILKGSPTDISGRTLIMRYALDHGLTYAETLRFLFAFQASVDPASSLVTGVQGWPVTEIPKPYKEWTHKAANEYLRRLLLGACAPDVKPVPTASDLCGGDAGGGGGGSKEQDSGAGIVICDGPTPFLTGQVEVGTKILTFEQMPAIPSVDPKVVELRLLRVPFGSNTVQIRSGGFIQTIAALGLVDSDRACNTFALQRRDNREPSVEAHDTEFTLHPIVRTPNGAAAQLLQHPVVIKSNESFCPADIASKKAGFHNAIGVLINVRCTAPVAKSLPAASFSLSALRNKSTDAAPVAAPVVTPVAAPVAAPAAAPVVAPAAAPVVAAAAPAAAPVTAPVVAAAKTARTSASAGAAASAAAAAVTAAPVVPIVVAGLKRSGNKDAALGAAQTKQILREVANAAADLDTLLERAMGNVRAALGALSGLHQVPKREDSGALEQAVDCAKRASAAVSGLPNDTSAFIELVKQLKAAHSSSAAAHEQLRWIGWIEGPLGAVGVSGTRRTTVDALAPIDSQDNGSTLTFTGSTVYKYKGNSMCAVCALWTPPDDKFEFVVTSIGEPKVVFAMHPVVEVDGRYEVMYLKNPPTSWSAEIVPADLFGGQTACACVSVVGVLVVASWSADECRSPSKYLVGRMD